MNGTAGEGGMDSSHEASTNAHCGLGRSTGGRPHFSHMQQVAAHPEGHPLPKWNILLRKYLGDNVDMDAFPHAEWLSPE